MKLIFILGNNPELSLSEIEAIFSGLKWLAKEKDFAVAEIASIDEIDFDADEIMKRLGGTIKIGRVLVFKAEAGVVGRLAEAAEQVANFIIEKAESAGRAGKINFGFSFYGLPIDSRLGMTVKKILTTRGLKSRLVISREKALSSVIVKTNKCWDFLIGADRDKKVFWGLTEAVQDFRDYGERDFGRPRSDSRSGMLPPKLAKMMINLAVAGQSDGGQSDGGQSDGGRQAKILDPFCGSGTVLTEAWAMGYKNLAGADISPKAVADTKENLAWLMDRAGEVSDDDGKVFLSDVRELSQKIRPQTIDAIVGEPYLGPPLKGYEKLAEIRKIAAELESLYLSAFKEFKKLLKPAGRVVLVFPQWRVAGGQLISLNISDKIKTLDFKRADNGQLVYQREGQHVKRQIQIWFRPESD